MAKIKVPYNAESEKAVIGSMIASKKVCNDALALLKESDFYEINTNGVIFRAIQNLSSQDKTIDNASLANELQINMKMLDQVGGVDYLAELQDYYIGDKNAEYHIKNVHDLGLIRALFNRANALQKEFYESEISDVSDFIAKYDKEISLLTKERASGEFKTTQEVIAEISKDLQKKRNSGKKSDVTGIETGFRYLNKLTAGWQEGSLNILAARPSVGKTAFAINLAYNAAKLSNKTVAFFSLEMSAADIAKRLLSSISSVNSNNLRNGDLSDYDWMAIQEAEDQLKRINLYIDDTSGIKLGEIKTKVTKLKARDPNLGLVVIDYLGLITLNNPKADNRQNIDEISRSLKGLARDLNVAILCLCQLSRANEKEKRKPIMSDLRDSGSIEQDADTVMFLYRENYQKTNQEDNKNNDQNSPFNESPFGRMEIIEVNLIKNRNGSIGLLKLGFLMNIGKFTEMDGE